MEKLKKALNAKLEEFDKKSKDLQAEPQKFEQNKMNVFASLTSGLKMKEVITQKLEQQRKKLEETQHEQLALQRVCEDTEIHLQKMHKELERVEKEKHFIDKMGDALIEKKSQEYGSRLKSKEDMEAEAREEIKRLQAQLEKELARLRELQEQYDRGKLELAELDKMLNQKEQEAKATSDLDDLDKQKAALQAQAKQLAADIAKAQQELQALKDKNAQL